ncbi:MAG: 4'-phosphopantetheinyl transferase superfamily protein [Balneolaceae bacterium]
MNEQKTLEYIDHPGLPPDIWTAACVLDVQVNSAGYGKEQRKMEKTAGRKLISGIAAGKLGIETLVIDAADHQKPVAVCDGMPVHISISHSGEVLCGVVSEDRVVGIDLEKMSREINPDLKGRIIHPDESRIAENLSPLQLWTLKEASLKWSGSGLRTAMNRVCLLKKEGPRFWMKLPDGRHLELCSFNWRGYWMSVAYDIC